MKPFKVLLLVVAGLLVTNQVGCKLGMPELPMPELSMPKISMPKVPKLAWWKNSDELDEDYIEPPSFQFSPSGGDSPANSNATSSPGDSDYSNLANRNRPQDKPYSTQPVSSDRLEPSSADRTKSLESFEQELSQAYQQLASTNPNPPSQTNQQAIQKTSPPQVRSKDFADHLPNRNSSFGQGASSQNSLQPKYGASTANSTNPLVPQMSSPATQYEKIAASDPNELPAYPSPLTPRADNVGTVSNAPDGVSGDRITNPYVKNQTASSIPNQSEAEAVQTVGFDQYPSTPHRPFQPRQSPPGDSPTSQNLPSNSSPAASTPNGNDQPARLPSSLLHGQGTYAPGSVKPLQPLSPDQVTIPQSSTGAQEIGGGSFQPN